MGKSVRKRFVILILLLAGFTLGACAGTIGQLNKTKKLWNEKDYTQIAEQEISCNASEKGCNQLHLIKGDACLRLAKEGANPLPHYQCAAKHLDLGIEQTRDWQMGDLNLNRAQTYENLCESLRQWQDLERGQTARQITERLSQTAQKFLAAEPGNLAAVYFLNSARYTMLQPELLNPGNSNTLCGLLNMILNAVVTEEPRTRATRYEANYRRLRLDVRRAKQAVPGCN